MYISGCKLKDGSGYVECDWYEKSRIKVKFQADVDVIGDSFYPG